MMGALFSSFDLSWISSASLPVPWIAFCSSRDETVFSNADGDPDSVSDTPSTTTRSDWSRCCSASVFGLVVVI